MGGDAGATLGIEQALHKVCIGEAALVQSHAAVSKWFALGVLHKFRHHIAKWAHHIGDRIAPR